MAVHTPPARHVRADLPTWPSGRPNTVDRSAETRRAEYRQWRRSRERSPWQWLLLVPIVLPLSPMLFNSQDPVLFGLPFFYWSQLAFALLACAVLGIVYAKVR